MADGRIVIDTKINTSNVDKELSSLESKLKATADKIQGTAKKMKSVGDTLTSKITKPALGAASALAGITLGKGFSRLVGIDTAQAKLKALGHDAKSVETIMNSALESVKGTAFGLDEAATTAASAVAAGVKPGKDLSRYLGLVGDAAAIAGVSMAEMGSIINQVQTGQTAYTDDLNQLADRGLPIYQWLADEAGIAASEVKKMASEGKISSEMFLAAIEKNIGGAAKTIGESSFTAALDNIWASIGRIGANFLDAGGKGGGFFSTLKPLLTDFNNSLGKVEDKAADLGVKFGEVFTGFIDRVKSAKKWFDDLSPAMQRTIGIVTGIGMAILVSIGPALKIIAALMSGWSNLTLVFGKLSKVIAGISGPVGWAILAITALVGAIIYLWNTNESFRDYVIKAWEAIKSALKATWDFLKPYIEKAMKAIVDFVKEQLAKMKKFWDENGDQIIQAAKNIWGFIEKIIVGFFNNFLVPLFKVVWPIVVAIVKDAWEGIKGLISGALDVIMGIIKFFSSLFTGDFKGMWEGIKQIFSGAIEFLYNLVMVGLVGRILKIAKGLVGPFQKVFSGMWDGTKRIFQAPIDWIVNLVKHQWDRIVTFSQNFSSSMRTGMSNLWDRMKDIFSKPIDWIRDRVTKGFNDVKERAVNIVSNMRDDIKERIDKIADWFTELPGRMADGLRKGAEGIRKAVVGISNKMLENMGKGVNGVIKGINWVLGKLKLETRLEEWTVPQYAQGTRGHPGGPAIVGDGKGSNAGSELIRTPDGKHYLSPPKPTMVNLPRGTHVLPARLTKQLIPHYAEGTGNWMTKIWENITNPGKLIDMGMEALKLAKPGGEGLIKDIALGGFKMLKDSAIDYLNGLLAGFFGSWGGGDITKLFPPPFRFTSGFGPRWGTNHNGYDFGAPAGTPIPAVMPGQVVFSGWGNPGSGYGGFGYAVGIRDAQGRLHIYGHNSKNAVKVGDVVQKGQIIGYVGNTGHSFGNHVHYEVRVNGKAIDISKDFGGMVPGGSKGAGVERWRALAAQALMMTGQYSPANLERLLFQMKTESGGNPRAINLWDINAKRGTPSKGLMQVIDPTFRAYAMPGFNTNIWDPLSNMLAAIRYSIARYGSLARAWRGVGYKDGTKYHLGGLAMVGEQGFELADIPNLGYALLGLAGPQILNLPKGTKVFTNRESKDMMKNISVPSVSLQSGFINKLVGNLSGSLKSSMSANGSSGTMTSEEKQSLILQLVSPDKREMAKWLIDDITSLQELNKKRIELFKGKGGRG